MAGIIEGINAGELPTGANVLPLTAPAFSGAADSATAASAKLWAQRSLAAGDALAYKFVPGVGLYLKTAAGTADGAMASSVTGGALGTTGVLAVGLHVWDPGGVTYRPARSANGSGDGLAGASNPITAAYTFNGTTWDRQRSNSSETALASAARTAAALSAALVNYEGRGVQVDVDVTAKAGATTLTVQLISTGNRVIAEVTGLAAAAGVQYSVQFYPGVIVADFEGTTGKGKSIMVPRNYKLQVVPSDASSVTYSVAVQCTK